MKGYDILGNVVIVKFERSEKAKQKKSFAEKLIEQHNNIKTVLEKTGKFKGRLRTLKTKFVFGVNTKEVVYRENNCTFRFNVDTCYFSPRLANERNEIAKMTKKGESVLVMFGGVGPFAVVIGRNSAAKRVVSVELSRECSKYAVENVKKNKLEKRVEIVQSDVRKVKLGEKFDRIVMARPNLKDSFLDVAFPLAKKGGIIHYYGFYEESEVNELKELIMNQAEKAKKKVKILKTKKAGDIGLRRYRYRVDFKVLN